MKVIFVDIDGVLKAFGNGSPPGRYAFNPRAVTALNTLTRWTDAKLVISSTWRMLPGIDLKHIFEQNGVEGEIIGETPVLYGQRGDEIEAWLIMTGRNVTGFVILDDDADMGALKSHLVQTNPMMGFLFSHVEKARLIMEKRDIWPR